MTGEFKAHEKGDEDRRRGRGAPLVGGGRLVDVRPRRLLNLFPARQPRTTATDRLWVTDIGSPPAERSGLPV